MIYLGENNGNLSETKKSFFLRMFLNPSENEKVFAGYEQRFSHNEKFSSCLESQRPKQSYYSDK